MKEKNDNLYIVNFYDAINNAKEEYRDSMSITELYDYLVSKNGEHIHLTVVQPIAGNNDNFPLFGRTFKSLTLNIKLDTLDLRGVKIEEYINLKSSEICNILYKVKGFYCNNSIWPADDGRHLILRGQKCEILTHYTHRSANNTIENYILFQCTEQNYLLTSTAFGVLSLVKKASWMDKRYIDVVYPPIIKVDIDWRHWKDNNVIDFALDCTTIDGSTKKICLFEHCQNAKVKYIGNGEFEIDRRINSIEIFNIHTFIKLVNEGMIFCKLKHEYRFCKEYVAETFATPIYINS